MFSWVIQPDGTRAADTRVDPAVPSGMAPPSVPVFFFHTPSTLATGLFEELHAASGGRRGHPEGRSRHLLTEGDDLIGSPTEAVSVGLQAGAPSGTNLMSLADFAALAKELAQTVEGVPSPTSAARPPNLLAALSGLYGRALGPALRIAASATKEVQILFSRRTLRTVYRVSGHPCLGKHFCTCSAFKYVVVNRGDSEHCKHQLALLLLHRFTVRGSRGLHRAVPSELIERIQAAANELQTNSASILGGASRLITPLASPHASQAAAAPGSRQAATHAGSGNSNATGAAAAQGGPGNTGIGMAAAAATLTYTDSDGLQWIEVSDATLTAILVG
jgi:hypothetical protein